MVSKVTPWIYCSSINSKEMEDLTMPYWRFTKTRGAYRTLSIDKGTIDWLVYEENGLYYVRSFQDL